MIAIVFAIGSGVWVGGLVTVTLAVVSSSTMGAERVLLFRRFGRKFAIFFGITGVFVVASALTLAVAGRSAVATASVVLAISLLVATAFGIAQARRMTVLRTAQADGAVTETQVRRNAAIAASIRALLVVGYVAVLVMAVILAVEF